MKPRFNIRRHLTTSATRRGLRWKLKRNYNTIMFGFNCVMLSVVLLGLVIAVSNHRIVVQPDTKQARPPASPPLDSEVQADGSTAVETTTGSYSADNGHTGAEEEEHSIHTDPQDNRLAGERAPTAETGLAAEQNITPAGKTEHMTTEPPAPAEEPAAVTLYDKAAKTRGVTNGNGIVGAAVIEPGHITLSHAGKKGYPFNTPAIKPTATRITILPPPTTQPAQPVEQDQVDVQQSLSHAGVEDMQPDQTKEMPDYQKLRENMLRVADALVKLNSTLCQRPKKEVSDAADELIQVSEKIASAKTPPE